MNCGVPVCWHVPCAQCMSFNKGSSNSCCAYPGQGGLKRPGSAGVWEAGAAVHGNRPSGEG